MLSWLKVFLKKFIKTKWSKVQILIMWCKQVLRNWFYRFHDSFNNRRTPQSGVNGPTKDNLLSQCSPSCGLISHLRTALFRPVLHGPTHQYRAFRTSQRLPELRRLLFHDVRYGYKKSDNLTILSNDAAFNVCNKVNSSKSLESILFFPLLRLNFN